MPVMVVLVEWKNKKEGVMKKLIIAVLVIFTVTAMSAVSHGGRLDKNGGHNCSAKSKKKGLCTGYHYHRSKDVSHSHE